MTAGASAASGWRGASQRRLCAARVALQIGQFASPVLGRCFDLYDAVLGHRPQIAHPIGWVTMQRHKEVAGAPQLVYQVWQRQIQVVLWVMPPALQKAADLPRRFQPDAIPHHKIGGQVDHAPRQRIDPPGGQRILIELAASRPGPVRAAQRCCSPNPAHPQPGHSRPPVRPAHAAAVARIRFIQDSRSFIRHHLNKKRAPEPMVLALQGALVFNWLTNYSTNVLVVKASLINQIS